MSARTAGKRAGQCRFRALDTEACWSPGWRRGWDGMSDQTATEGPQVLVHDRSHAGRSQVVTFTLVCVSYAHTHAHMLTHARTRTHTLALARTRQCSLWWRGAELRPAFSKVRAGKDRNHSQSHAVPYENVPNLSEGPWSGGRSDRWAEKEGCPGLGFRGTRREEEAGRAAGVQGSVCAGARVR